jgi:hypothetical protein
MSCTVAGEETKKLTPESKFESVSTPPTSLVQGPVKSEEALW